MPKYNPPQPIKKSWLQVLLPGVVAPILSAIIAVGGAMFGIRTELSAVATQIKNVGETVQSMQQEVRAIKEAQGSLFQNFYPPTKSEWGKIVEQLGAQDAKMHMLQQEMHEIKSNIFREGIMYNGKHSNGK